jgi:hypothetical protein
VSFATKNLLHGKPQPNAVLIRVPAGIINSKLKTVKMGDAEVKTEISVTQRILSLGKRSSQSII